MEALRDRQKVRRKQGQAICPPEALPAHLDLDSGSMPLPKPQHLPASISCSYPTTPRWGWELSPLFLSLNTPPPLLGFPQPCVHCIVPLLSSATLPSEHTVSFPAPRTLMTALPTTVRPSLLFSWSSVVFEFQDSKGFTAHLPRAWGEAEDKT